MKKIVISFHNHFKNSIIKNEILRSSLHIKLCDSFRKAGFDVSYYVEGKMPDADLYIYFDMPYPWRLQAWSKIVKNKNRNILYIFEPSIIQPFQYNKFFLSFFKEVHTYNDDIVDNKKFFKHYFPQSLNDIDTKELCFDKKRFLILINSNKFPLNPLHKISFLSNEKELYSERQKALNFFDKTIPGDFCLYGVGWNKPKRFSLKEKIFGFKKYQSYKGPVDQNKKIKLLSNFKYSICFENSADNNGYISEKIFDCFKAKCVPIYWGSSNIEKYIPKECFIDYRKFMNYRKLLIFLENINEKEYNQYMYHINLLLKNKKIINTWFEDGWVKSFTNRVLNFYKNIN